MSDTEFNQAATQSGMLAVVAAELDLDVEISEKGILETPELREFLTEIRDRYDSVERPVDVAKRAASAQNKNQVTLGDKL